MVNLSNSQKNSQSSEGNFLGYLIEFAPVILLIGLVSSFIIMSIIEFLFWKAKLQSTGVISVFLAIAIPFILEGARLAFAASSAQNFFSGEKQKGWFGFICSIAISLFLIIFEVDSMAHHFSKDAAENKDALYTMFTFIIVIGVVFEGRLIMLSASAAKMPTLLASTPPAAANLRFSSPTTVGQTNSAKWDEKNSKSLLVTYFKRSKHSKMQQTQADNLNSFMSLSDEFRSRGYTVEVLPNNILSLTMLDDTVFESDINDPSTSYKQVYP